MAHHPWRASLAGSIREFSDFPWDRHRIILWPMTTPLIVMFTDFGLEGPYVGQVKAVLASQAPQSTVIDLFADAPAHDPEAAAYLLAAYSGGFPPGTVFLCVVDPGVGDRNRAPVVVSADGHWFVGPDNGLFNVIASRAKETKWFDITWRPDHLSNSFHGRDLFAPVAAMLAVGREIPGDERAANDTDPWPGDLEKIIYIDNFGNAITGIRAASLGAKDQLTAGGHTLQRARTFSDVPENEGMWFENANELAEIAVNCGRADQEFDLVVGTDVTVQKGDG